MKGVFLLVAAVVVVGSGCNNRGDGEKEPVAVKAVFETNLSMSGLFPTTPKTVRCVIPGGGPAPGIRIPGTCTTLVTIAGDGSAVVRLRETWDGHHFNGPGSSARPGLEHTWEFTVTKSGRVRSSRDYGDFPPQSVM